LVRVFADRANSDLNRIANMRVTLTQAVRESCYAYADVYCSVYVLIAFHQTIVRICLHDVYLMHTRAESACEAEKEVPGQHKWHT
jgi:hypothetical protein